MALPLAMYGVRAAIPATSHLNVVKYANLVSLLQTNELLGNYRNLFWFGTPIGLPLVEWTAAVFYSAVRCGVLHGIRPRTAAARRQARPCVGADARTKATSVIKEEGKLFVLNGAAVFLAAFLAFGVYQGVTSELHRRRRNLLCLLHEAYLRPVDGREPRLADRAGRGVCPDAGRAAARGGELSSEAMLPTAHCSSKYNIYQQVVQNNINYYLKEHPGAWLVYERLQKVVRFQRHR